MRYAYWIEVQDGDQWVRLFGGVGLEWGRGYLAHQRHAPSPRLALRLVRSDGRVMDEAPGIEEASIGMVAGWPTADQYRRAAERCLQLALSARP